MKKFFVTLTLILVCVCVFSVSAAAIYTSGTQETNRYYSPLRFDFEILGSTAQLTPTISYSEGATLTRDTFEQATQVLYPSDFITSVNRTNFQVSTVSSTCVDVSYRLSFNVSQPTNSFTMRITSPGGIYDFVKYGVPELAIPTGYSVVANVSYNVRFTQSQPNTSELTDYVQYTQTYSSNGDLPLIKDTYLSNGSEHDIIGGVLVNDYVATLTFTSGSGGSSDGTFGDPGYYLFDSVLSITDPNLEEMWYASEDYEVYFYEPVYVHGLSHGVVDTVQVGGIVLMDIDGWSTVDLYYDFPPDEVLLVYDFDDDQWYSATSENSNIEIGEISAENMRMLQFTDTLSNTFYGSNTFSEAQRNYIVSVVNWFYDNVTYNRQNPLTTVQITEGSSTYTFSDGDGGMYFHYYADRMLDYEISATYADYYSFAYSNGFANGDGEFSADYGLWLGTAVGGFMDLELFPNFSVGGVISTVVAICLLLAFLKFFAGG